MDQYQCHVVYYTSLVENIIYGYVLRVHLKSSCLAGHNYWLWNATCILARRFYLRHSMVLKKTICTFPLNTESVSQVSGFVNEILAWGSSFGMSSAELRFYYRLFNWLFFISVLCDGEVYSRSVEEDGNATLLFLFTLLKFPRSFPCLLASCSI